MTLRSLEALKCAEIIICEDTRVGKRLIQLLNEREILPIKEYQFYSFHSHNEKSFLSQISRNFFERDVVYMSDAGMPCVSDPGAGLVRYAQDNGILYTVLPGANALLTVFAASGSASKEFYFYGFLPHKSRERASELLRILEFDCDLILYESPHRLLELLDELEQLAPGREIFAGKELTKLHERFYKGMPNEIKSKLKAETRKGEWAVLIYRDSARSCAQSLSLADLATLELPPKVRAKIMSKMTGKSVEECYKTMLAR